MYFFRLLACVVLLFMNNFCNGLPILKKTRIARVTITPRICSAVMSVNNEIAQKIVSVYDMQARDIHSIDTLLYALATDFAEEYMEAPLGVFCRRVDYALMQVLFACALSDEKYYRIYDLLLMNEADVLILVRAIIDADCFY